MKKNIIITCILLLFAAYNVSASELRDIELNDGSVISGEIVSFKNGIYKVKSQSMGILEIEGSKISEIRAKSKKADKSSSSIPVNNFSNSDIQSMAQSLMTNETVMSMIMGLQNDPEIQKILQDPKIMEAVNAGDITTLLSSPEFKKLLENQKIKGITKEIVK